MDPEEVEHRVLSRQWVNAKEQKLRSTLRAVDFQADGLSGHLVGEPV
jgi:hypothetical protein